MTDTTYAGGRRCFDADSHIMETTDWLVSYAEPGVRDRIRPLDLGKGGGALAARAVEAAERRRGDVATAAALEEHLMTAKGWGALGAFDPDERVRALDLLGFDAQLVFPTFAATQFAGKDLELLYGGAKALNRGIAEFCSVDDRLLAVASVPLDDPELSAQAIDDALAVGCRTIMFPSAPPRERSPSHPDYDAVWARLQDADVPFQLHIGGGGRLIDPVWHRNDRPVTDHLGGGENLRSKDYMGISFSPQVFLATLIFDGVFERFPGLRGGVIEQGAVWVVSWMKQLDLARQSFRRTEPYLDALPLEPSEYARRHLFVTPFPNEPIDWLIEQAGDDMFMFSSDYPHPEGGRDPIAKFERSLAGVDETAVEKFYVGNFAAMMALDA